MSYRMRSISPDGVTGHGPWLSGIGALEALEEHVDFMRAAEPNSEFEIESSDAPE